MTGIEGRTTSANTISRSETMTRAKDVAVITIMIAEEEVVVVDITEGEVVAAEGEVVVAGDVSSATL